MSTYKNVVIKLCKECINYYEQQISESIRMIGAMPAVAVRHERRRHENRVKRPCQLYLGSQWSQPSTGSPLTTSSCVQNRHNKNIPEVYLCGKISGLYTVVTCLLLGAVILVVGLVQLSPGAPTSDQKLAYLISGTVFILFGTVLAGIRCYLLHCVFVSAESTTSSLSHAASEIISQPQLSSKI